MAETFSQHEAVASPCLGFPRSTCPIGDLSNVALGNLAEMLINLICLYL